VQVIGLLRDETPLSQLLPFFQATFRHLHQKRRENQILVNIATYQAIKVKRQLFKLHSRVIHITSDTICVVCKKSVGAAYA
jgi:hypothetical protein